jgi:acyl-CoA thioesterase FadM
MYSSDILAKLFTENSCAENGKYAFAARLGDAVTIESKLLEIGTNSTRWEQSATLSSSGKLLVSADIELGFVNPDGSMVTLPRFPSIAYTFPRIN